MKSLITHNALNKTKLACLLGALFSTAAIAQTDLTSDNPNVIRASGENGDFEGRIKAFDDNKYSKWLTFTSSGWISYQFAQPQKITSYTLTSANDAPNRDPQDWQLQGSNDGENWTTLDTRYNQSFSARHQTKQFSVANLQSFSFVKVDISSTKGANILQLAEIEMFSDDITPPSNLPISQSNSLNAGQWQHFGPFNVAGKVIATTTGNGDADLYMRRTAQPTTQLFDCSSTTSNANESCTLQGNDVYVSVYGYSNTSYTINIKEETTTPPTGEWKKPQVNFVDVDPQTQGAILFKRIISDPADHMANRCVDVAKILYRDPVESNRFRNLQFELRAKDHWGNEFVAYKMGQDGSGEMTIVVSTSHLEKIYRDNGNSDAAIRNEIDGILSHEVTHGYNNSPLTHDNYGDGKAYWAYTEGLADAVRIGEGLHKTRTPNVNDPKKWLGGYTTTGFFLHYVRVTHDPDFLYKFNKAAKDLGNYTWSFDAAFQQILGRGVEDLWQEYATFINNGGQLEY
ncbi:discoidin domain-containing protein [Pseudoalteromonas luteoviolacea]|uniref:basic secretory protein-like protein n=1 Tax=Pseudoalteromonas luteoviolacea TaxID=43657 RepID=UPI001F336999|nr:basic secretory protein-like protein [Pseudoalteromonas luteoviolacea]MCF6439778.1 discoidin domain-containing protein [Pseudoalteromonas luteoviolacea]